MNKLNERIKKLRKALDLTQQEFADKLCIKRNTVATYERGKSDPSDAAVILICKTFNVSESWLRTGEGEMFVELPRNEALAAQIQSFLQGGTDSFRERLVSLLLRLTPEQWDALEGYLRELTAAPAPAREIVPAGYSSREDLEREADQFAAMAREQFLSEKLRASEASSVNASDAG